MTKQYHIVFRLVDGTQAVEKAVGALHDNLDSLNSSGRNFHVSKLINDWKHKSIVHGGMIIFIDKISHITVEERVVYHD